jgi:tRNA-specific 2-thiouridylase
MDVCFITKGGREAFLGERVDRAPGSIVSVDGEILGQHDGVDRFTIGQRRGLGVAVGDRRYVVDINANEQIVTIGERRDLLRSSVALRNLDFASARPASSKALAAQTRAHGTPALCRLDGDNVVWDEPQPRVAPGQVVVMYDDDVVVGGGIAL